jgi:hypothetical protein
VQERERQTHALAEREKSLTDDLERERTIFQSELEAERRLWREEQEKRAKELSRDRQRLEEERIKKEADFMKRQDAERQALQAAWEHAAQEMAGLPG